MSDFALNRAEQDSALWKRLEAHMKLLREAYREKIERPQEQPETDRLRGRIAALTELIDLGKTEGNSP